MMETKDATRLGMNRSGVATSPVDTKEMIADADTLTRPTFSEGDAIGVNRLEEIRKADPIGHIPIPTTFRGAMTGLRENFLLGGHILIDKLGERLAFERTGTRLYDALLIKHQASSEELGLPSFEEVRKIRDEEYQHFLMLSEVIQEFGADPTAVTPSANVAAVISMGLPQVLTDPRTTFMQCLDAILVAELADNDSWDMLIQLTEEAGLKETTEKFRHARHHEAQHLAAVRKWITEMGVGKRHPRVKTEAGAPSPSEVFKSEKRRSV